MIDLDFSLNKAILGERVESQMKFPKENKYESQVSLSRVLEFLRTVTPFDILDAKELAHLVSRTEIAFFPRGQRIVSKGDPVYRHLYIIQQGAARISLVDDHGRELLVDVRGEGDYFGASSLLEGKPPMFDISAQQDLVALLLPAKELQQLVAKYPMFKRYFGSSLARTIQAVRQSVDCQQPAPIGQNTINLDAFMSGKNVADLMSKDVLTCTPEVSAQTAARLMAQHRVSSIVVSGNGIHPLGIVTDNDLRNNVLAAGLSGETAVSTIAAGLIGAMLVGLLVIGLAKIAKNN